MTSWRTVIPSWFCSEGGGVPLISTFGGTSTSSPICRIGVATMKMISSTSTTSTSGVMLISERTPEPLPPNAISALPLRDLRSGLLVLGKDADGGEAGLVGAFHHQAYFAEVDPLVGLEGHGPGPVFDVLRLDVARDVLVGDPVLADEDRPVALDRDDEVRLLAGLLHGVLAFRQEDV